MTANRKLDNLSRNLQKPKLPAAIIAVDEHAHPHWAHFLERAKIIGEVIIACKNILVNLTIALVAFVTIVVLLKTVASRTVTVKPIPVPARLSSLGYTEKVLATRIAAKLAEINQVAISERRRVPKLPVVLIEDRPDIKIPGEAVSFQTIVSYLKEVVGLQDVQVSVDVTEDEKNLAAQIRIIGGPGSGSQTLAESPITIDADEFVQEIATETMRLFSPEILASYKLSVAVSKCHGSRACDTAEALKLFNEILARSTKPDASYVWALKGKANTLQEMGRDDEALDYVERILTINKEDADAYLVWANALSHKNQIDLAIEKYRHALKIDPFSVAANINLGILYKKQCRLDDAIQQYKEALKYNPRSVGAHYNLGLALYAKSKPGAATCGIPAGALSAEQATQITPEQESLRKSAIDEYKLAVEIDPTYVAAYQNLGSIYTDMNKQKWAMEAYQNAIAADPTYARPYKNLGDLWLAKGDQQQAVALLNKAIALQPSYPEAYESLAKAMEKEGNMEEAKNKMEYAATLKKQLQQKSNTEN